MVITSPMIKVAIRTINSFEDPVRYMPMPSPMGIIAISAPRVKKPMPMMSRAAPTINIRIVPVCISKITAAIRIIAVIGRTEENASIILSFKILFIKRLNNESIDNYGTFIQREA
jgi:hypothetical protein